MTNGILAIDPAVESIWWARFHGRELVGGGQFAGNHYLMREFVVGQTAHASRVVIEEPQVYQGPRAKGDPEDLIQLAKTVGACAAVNRPVTFVKPREWKGQLPKDVCWRRCMSVLTQGELAVYQPLSRAYPKGQLHNLHDAIGIGLDFLGRTPRSRG